MEGLNGLAGAANSFFLIPNSHPDSYRDLILNTQSSLTIAGYPSTHGLSGSMLPVLTGFCRFLPVERYTIKQNSLTINFDA
jgi:hypothetical protein